MSQDLVYRLRERARIRRQIPSRKSVQEGQPDRIADLLDEAADEIERLMGQLISGFYEDKMPFFRQGEPKHELEELVTAEEVSAYVHKIVELTKRIEGLLSFKRSVDEALNSGDGSYRP